MESIPFPEKGVAGGSVHPLEKWLMGKFLEAMGGPALRVVLWDGKELGNGYGESSVGMVIRDRLSLWRLMTNPFLHFGEAYSAGRIEIQGGVAAFMQAVYTAMAAARKLPRRSGQAAFKGNGTGGNTLSASRDNIHHHYDIGSRFYELWLDTEMVYTCAYFPTPAASLEEAQIAKMELVCRKLRLKPGQKVVEAGCGWGALARYMAKHYGVSVKAFNISRDQIAYARERAKAEGLTGHVDFIEDDYRNMAGKCDAFVSVGMLEHVGPDNYRELGKVIDSCLSDHGFGLIHTIGQNNQESMSPWLLKHIFPGAYPPTLREMMEIFEPWGFTVLDLENLRLHYARTLEHWLERFERNVEIVKKMFDDSFVRTWRLYLGGSIANFTIGYLQLYQVVFARDTNNLVPWTRSHLASWGSR